MIDKLKGFKEVIHRLGVAVSVFWLCLRARNVSYFVNMSMEGALVRIGPGSVILLVEVQR